MKPDSILIFRTKNIFSKFSNFTFQPYDEIINDFNN